ncbi:MAG: hypothetical protein JNM00_02645 [Flavobacteriales bacterium]|nr:hypothetical protein [Flavobacteriales bacterium]
MFPKLFDGYELRQSDVDHFIGMSKEIADYRILHDGDEPLWTNSMFGGMPAYQISVIHHSNLMRSIDSVLKLGLPAPVGILFIAMLGFYILCLCMRVNPWLGIVGGLAFGLASFNVLFMTAGHVSKVNAVAYLAPTLGGMLLAMRGKWLLGGAVFGIFFSLHLSTNHLQITYYLAIMLAVVGIGEAIHAVMRKEFARWWKGAAAVAVMSVLAILPAAGNLATTAEYSSYTTRGATELTKNPDGTPIEGADQNGLDPTYMLEYNLGKGELFSVFVPNIKGGHAGGLGTDKEISKQIQKEARGLPDERMADQFMQNLSGMNRYWGEQKFSGGAFYLGAAAFLLFLLGLFFAKDAIRWPAMLLAFLALALSLKSPDGLNAIFIESMPLYNKFRDTKMILVLLQVLVPLMGVLFLQRLSTDTDFRAKKKMLYITGGGIVLVLGLMFIAPTTFFDLQSAAEKAQFEEVMASPDMAPEQMEFVTQLLASMDNIRASIMKADLGRSLGFMVLVMLVVLMAFWKRIPMWAAIVITGAVVLADQFTVDRRYVNDEREKNIYRYYVKADEKYLPFDAGVPDKMILDNEKSAVKDFEEVKNALIAGMKSGTFKRVRNNEKLEEAASFGALGLRTNFRVLKLTELTGDATTSYFHKSLGGYHGAKLKQYNELIEYELSRELRLFADTVNALGPERTMAMLPAVNMLNARYIIYAGNQPPMLNPKACGNAWFVEAVKEASSADEELAMFDGLIPDSVCIVGPADKGKLTAPAVADSAWSITLEEYGTNVLKYKSKSSVAAPAVFSEIHYPAGWTCLIDGEEVEYARVNYVLRGIMLPAGEHEIEWRFEPESFAKYGTVSLAGSWLLILLVLGALGLEVRRTMRQS